MAEIQMVSMWTKIASNLKSMKNNNLPNLLFEKYILCLFNIYDKTRQCIKKQRHHFADKGLYSQSYVFFPLDMYECESWTVKKAERPRTDAFKLWC